MYACDLNKSLFPSLTDSMTVSLALCHVITLLFYSSATIGSRSTCFSISLPRLPLTDPIRWNHWNWIFLALPSNRLVLQCSFGPNEGVGEGSLGWRDVQHLNILIDFGYIFDFYMIMKLKEKDSVETDTGNWSCFIVWKFKEHLNDLLKNLNLFYFIMRNLKVRQLDAILKGNSGRPAEAPLQQHHKPLHGYPHHAQNQQYYSPSQQSSQLNHLTANQRQHLAAFRLIHDQLNSSSRI